MILDTDTNYHINYDADAFVEFTEHPERYVDHMFNVDTMNLDGSVFGGWTICVLRKLDDRYVFIPLFDSMKEAFLYDATPIETYLVTSFTMRSDRGSIDPDNDFVRTYALPESVIKSFNSRAKRKDGNLAVTVLCEGVTKELVFMPSMVVEYR
jgi:hypothetical protein